MRPFGVSLMMAGYDENGPQLYQVDPSGSYFAWKASAIGKNMVNAKAFLEKRYSEDMELEDAIHTALLTLKEGFEGEAELRNRTCTASASASLPSHFHLRACHIQGCDSLELDWDSPCLLCPRPPCR